MMLGANRLIIVQVTKWHISPVKRAHIATRKGMYRKAKDVLLQRIEIQGVMPKTYSQAASGTKTFGHW